MLRTSLPQLVLAVVVLLSAASTASAVYDPKLGRWIERDPIGYAAGTMNLYENVVSNPLAHIDPYGLQAVGKVGDPSRRFQDIWHSIDGCIPDMSRPIRVWEGEGPNRKLVGKTDQSINDARGKTPPCQHE